MSSKNVKFEISLKELKVTFEGDIQTAERMQSQITGAINSLATVQQRMLSPAAGVQPVPQMGEVSGSAPRKRRRRRSTAVSGIDPAILDATAVPENGNGGTENGQAPERRARRSGSADLITALKAEGFFTEKRKIGDIKAALANKGHTFKSNEISPTLIALTQAETLKREKDPTTKRWMYFTD